jgi:hypothetical protein
MLSRCRHVLVLFWFALLAIAATTSSSSRAQDDPETVTARQRFQEGVKYFDAGQYAKARVAFLQAYALKQHPAVLLNLAQSEIRMPGHEALAAQHFTEYLRKAPDAGKRSEAESGLEKAKEKVATVTVTVDRDGARLFLDGEPYGTSPLEDPVYLKPGSHKLEARVDDDSRTEEVEAKAGAETTVELAFDSAPSAPAAATAPAASPAAPAAEPPKRERKEKKERTERADATPSEGRESFPRWFIHKPFGILLGVVTLGGIGTGVGLQVGAQQKFDDADAIEQVILAQAVADGKTELDTGQKPCGDWKSIPPLDDQYYDACSAWVDAHGRGQDLATASYFAFGGAALAGAGLVTYYFIDTKPNRQQAALHVGPMITGTTSGLVIGGRF